jgi:hypothetical protein
MHGRNLDRAGTPRLPAAGRVSDPPVPLRLDEHVARTAARMQPVRVGSGHETGAAAADLADLLFRCRAETSPRTQARTYGSTRPASGHGFQPRRDPKTPGSRPQNVARFLAWSAQPFPGDCSVPTTEERRTGLTGSYPVHRLPSNASVSLTGGPPEWAEGEIFGVARVCASVHNRPVKTVGG